MDVVSPNHSHRFIRDLEAARQRAGMSVTRFGYVHFGDPGFVQRMRKGQRLQQKTIERIHRVINSV